jgi:hypothetical protein
MIPPATARSLYILPALHQLKLYSIQAEKLLMGTAAIESNFTNFVQFHGGPARGMFQMEPPTFKDMLTRVLSKKHNADLKAAVYATSKYNPPIFSELQMNHLLAAAMARVKYFSVHPPIPFDLEGQAHFWWTYYNGRSPHGLKPKDYIASWNRFCAPLYATRTLTR